MALTGYPFSHGYCNTGHVEYYFPNLELYSNLNDARFDQAIEDSTIEIDAILSRFYVVPVTDPTGFALTYLQQIAKYWAAGLCHKLYFKAVAKATGTTTVGAPRGGGWSEYACGMLDRVVPPRDKSSGQMPGFQPFPSVRFFNAPLQPNTEMPDWPEGASATFNPDNDMDLTQDQEPFFARTDRVVFKGGLI